MIWLTLKYLWLGAIADTEVTAATLDSLQFPAQPPATDQKLPQGVGRTVSFDSPRVVAGHWVGDLEPFTWHWKIRCTEMCRGLHI